MNEVQKSFARCFTTASGAAVIDHLRSMTLDRTLGPNASDNDLRWLEAQRALVRQILSLVARGQKGDA
jgi:hypothetical protein